MMYIWLTEKYDLEKILGHRAYLINTTSDKEIGSDMMEKLASPILDAMEKAEMSSKCNIDDGCSICDLYQ